MQHFVAQQTALGRVGLPDDVGSVVAFLCMKEAEWPNGQHIELTGGQPGRRINTHGVKTKIPLSVGERDFG